ncbi:MAG: hypothetical protein Q8S32_06455 [Burkholderiaceae bacterium]|nr:hypothetical protein [Burkholderiaceae bacterium]
MQQELGGIRFRFDGLDAGDHKADLYSLGESLQGLARIAAVAGHFALTQEYSKYFSVHEVRIVATEPKANCFSIDAVWEFVKQQQILSGGFGAIGAVIISYILASNANKAEEMKLLKDSLDKAIRELGSRDDKIVMGLLGVIEKMTVDLRPSAKQAVAPIGKSAATLTISSSDGNFSSSYDINDAEQIRKMGDNEISDAQTIVVKVTELDKVRGSAKVNMDGEPEEKRVNAVISDPLLEMPNNKYALALASGEKIAVRAKIQSNNGEISKIYIFDVEA